MKKNACITGASRGIGRAIALKFAEKGYDLALSCEKNSAQLEQTARDAAAHGARCLCYTGDLGRAENCAALFHEITQSFARLDVLVCNAGISHLGLLQDMSVEEWDSMIQSDLSSVFYLSRLAIPMMLSAGQGKIINLSSVWGHAGASCEVSYSAAKGGVNSFTKALAKELAPSNIQVNAIAPGVIDTEMNQWLSSEDRAALEEEIPAGRFGTPEEVAELALTLAESSSYLTGQIITLSGGWQL